MRNSLLLARVSTMAMAFVYCGVSLAFVEPPITSSPLATTLSSDALHPGKDGNNHTSFNGTEYFSEATFEEITGVPYSNACLVLGDSSSSLVQPLLLLTVPGDCPEPMTSLGFAIQMASGSTDDYTTTISASNDTETVTLSTHAEINMYQISTENWSGSLIGYAITFEAHSSVTGDSSIVAFYPVKSIF